MRRPTDKWRQYRDQLRAQHPFLFIVVASLVTTPLFYIVVAQGTRNPPVATIAWESVILGWWSTDLVRRHRDG